MGIPSPLSRQAGDRGGGAEPVAGSSGWNSEYDFWKTRFPAAGEAGVFVTQNPHSSKPRGP